MFRHTGTRRTFQHNLWLAVVLSLNAGFINSAGFIAFAVLTTNVTGHAAHFAVDLNFLDWQGVRQGILCMFLFFAGAFFSAWYARSVGRDQRYAYTIPLSIEVIILLFVSYYGNGERGGVMGVPLFAGSLLFAMGMQNALVTMVSKSVVRTTHLTGMFTDLGINLAEALGSQLRIGRMLRQRLLLQSNIILFFLIGGVIGAYCFLEFGYTSFYGPAGLVGFTIFF